LHPARATDTTTGRTSQSPDHLLICISGSQARWPVRSISLRLKSRNSSISRLSPQHASCLAAAIQDAQSGRQGRTHQTHTQVFALSPRFLRRKHVYRQIAHFSIGARSSASLLRTLPTRWLTGQAVMRSAGNGRIRSTGSRSSLAVSIQRR
jgi:hypothetical protein